MGMRWTEDLTDFAYFSGLLPGAHPAFFGALSRACDELAIPWALLGGTRDIWCRDYMPIQTGRHDFTVYPYDPSYLKNRRGSKTRTAFADVEIERGVWRAEAAFKRTPVVLDGGNVVLTPRHLLLGDSVLTENERAPRRGELGDGAGVPVPRRKAAGLSPKARAELLSALEEGFGAPAILLPRLPGDPFGHADGMVRFFKDRQLFVNEWMGAWGSFNHDLRTRIIAGERLLEEDGYELLGAPYVDRPLCLYLNYLRVGNKLVVPTFGHRLDDQALGFFREHFGRENVRGVDSREVAQHGGVLNCLSWTISVSRPVFGPPIL